MASILDEAKRIALEQIVTGKLVDRGLTSGEAHKIVKQPWVIDMAWDHFYNGTPLPKAMTEMGPADADRYRARAAKTGVSIDKVFRSDFFGSTATKEGDPTLQLALGQGEAAPPAPTRTARAEPLTRSWQVAQNPAVEAPTAKPYEATPASWAMDAPRGRTPASDFQTRTAKYVPQMMNDLNLTRAQAEGVMGSIGAETEGFKYFHETKQPADKGGIGWLQWTNSQGHRRDDFEAFAARNGLDVRSDEASYRFFVHEATNTAEARGFNKVRNAATAGQAARAFDKNYLRPGKPHPAKSAEYVVRAAGLAPSLGKPEQVAALPEGETGVTELPVTPPPPAAPWNLPKSRAFAALNPTAPTPGGKPDYTQKAPLPPDYIPVSPPLPARPPAGAAPPLPQRAPAPAAAPPAAITAPPLPLRKPLPPVKAGGETGKPTPPATQGRITPTIPVTGTVGVPRGGPSAGGRAVISPQAPPWVPTAIRPELKAQQIPFSGPGATAWQPRPMTPEMAARVQAVRPDQPAGAFAKAAPGVPPSLQRFVGRNPIPPPMSMVPPGALTTRSPQVSAATGRPIQLPSATGAAQFGPQATGGAGTVFAPVGQYGRGHVMPPPRPFSGPQAPPWTPTPQTPEMQARVQPYPVTVTPSVPKISPLTQYGRAHVMPAPLPFSGPRAPAWTPAPQTPEMAARVQPYPVPTTSSFAKNVFATPPMLGGRSGVGAALRYGAAPGVPPSLAGLVGRNPIPPPATMNAIPPGFFNQASPLVSALTGRQAMMPSAYGMAQFAKPTIAAQQQRPMTPIAPPRTTAPMQPRGPAAPYGQPSMEGTNRLGPTFGGGYSPFSGPMSATKPLSSYGGSMSRETAQQHDIAAAYGRGAAALHQAAARAQQGFQINRGINAARMREAMGYGGGVGRGTQSYIRRPMSTGYGYL